MPKVFFLPPNSRYDIFLETIKNIDLLWLFQAEGEDFEALPWYSAVETFCHGQGFEESDAADEKTLPAIIEKAVLPKVRGKAKLCFDSILFSLYYALYYSLFIIVKIMISRILNYYLVLT